MRKRRVALLLGLLCPLACVGRDGGMRTAEQPPLDGRFVAAGAASVRDEHTGLEWTKRDNARDVDWHGGDRYCRNLSLGDRADWRLPEIGELAELYDERLDQACGEAVCHIDPMLELTKAYVWAATARDSRRFYFDFRFGTSLAPNLKPGLVRRVLCVRP
jgi:hypothetical protein